MEVEFSMRVSYLELYNEELCDLLSTDDTAKIRIFDDVNKKGSVIVQGLEEIPVRCKSDVYRLLAKGQERRRTAATLMNAQSSRSHTVFSILVHIKEIGNDDEEMLKIGKLNLVDLAGSENISKAGNEKGIRTRESVNINQSLLTLGRVITALVERTPHIPYRESKLTRLLQESLGGRTKTSIIATVSPGHKDLEETLSTLDYAHRAKHIQNKPEINQRLTKKVVLKEYTEEIDRLKRDLNAAREKNGIYLASDTYNDMLYKMETQQKELNEKIHVFKSLKEEIADKTKMFEDCQRNLEDVSSTLIIEQGKVRITEAELSKTKRNLRKTERQHEESKHLVSCHQKTEKLLTDHAKQLLDVVEEASDDTKGLLASIARRKDVEEKAVTETDQLLRNLTNNIVEVQHEMEQLKKKHNQSTTMIVTDLEINTKANKEFTRSVLTSLAELRTVRNDSDDRVQKMIAEWKTKTGDDSKAESEKLTALLKAMEQQQAVFYASIKEKVGAMEQTLKKESTENESMRSQLLEKINFQNAEIDKFCSDLKEKISSHCNDFSRVSTQMKQKTSAQKENLRKIQQMMAEVEKQLKAEIEDDYSPILNEFDEINAKLMAVESNNIKTFSENNSLILGEKMGCLKNVEDSHAEMSEKLKQLFTGAAGVVNDDDVVTKAKIKEAVELVAASEGQLKARLDEINSSVKAEFEATAETQAVREETVTDLINNEGARSLVKATEVKSMVEQTLSGYVNTAEAGITGKLSSCTSDITRFEDQDVLKYKSSGETPARKDYKCNKNLVATSPHDRIIKRFRLERNFSESQLDSSILEVSAEYFSTCRTFFINFLTTFRYR